MALVETSRLGQMSLFYSTALRTEEDLFLGFRVTARVL